MGMVSPVTATSVEKRGCRKGQGCLLEAKGSPVGEAIGRAIVPVFLLLSSGTAAKMHADYVLG